MKMLVKNHSIRAIRCIAVRCIAVICTILILLPLCLIGCKGSDSADTTAAQTTDDSGVTAPPTTEPEPIPVYPGIRLNDWTPDPVGVADRAPALLAGKNTLTVLNNYGSALSLHLVFSEPITTESGESVTDLSLTVPDEDQAVVTFEAQSGVLDSIRIACDGSDYRYIYTENGLFTALNAGETCTLCPCVNLQIADELTVAKPFTLRLTAAKLNFSGSILVSSKENGTVSITEDKEGLFHCKEFFAEAPSFDFILPTTLSDVMNTPSFYLRAKSLNKTPIPAGERLITSAAALDRLLDPDRLPNLREGDTIRFSGQFTLSKEYSFDFPLNFNFEKGVTLENPIQLKTSKECAISILDSDSTLPQFPVMISAPKCDLTWESCTLSLIEIGANLNIRSLNGRNIEEYILGGSGEAKITQVSMLKAENPNLSESVTWTLDAESCVLRATIKCVLDPGLLKNAKLTVMASSGGEVTFDEATAQSGLVDLTDPLGAYLTVTDKNGEICRYVILTEYIPMKLPVVIIETEGHAAVTSKEEYINATISINSDYVDAFPSLDATMVQIRGRGNSTWGMDKKPYKLKFPFKTSVLGMEKAKDWTLLANYIDYSLIRNTVALDAAAYLAGMPFAMSQHPVDVFFNGEYVGVYSIGEQIEVKSGRVELTDNGTDVDTGYLLEVGGTTSADTWDVTCFQTELMKYVKVRTANTSELTKEQVAFIKDYVKKADAAIIAGEGYEDYIDMDSLIDWFILHEISYNVDSSFRRSCFLTKDAGGKLKMGPSWDFDLAFGMFNRCPKDGKGWACLYESSDDYLWTNWMSYLLKDQKFIDMLQKRWDEVKDGLLEHMMAAIDYYGELVAPSAAYNFTVWKILGVKNRFQPTYTTKYNTYELQLQFFKDYLTLRWNWIDQNIKVVE